MITRRLLLKLVSLAVSTVSCSHDASGPVETGVVAAGSENSLTNGGPEADLVAKGFAAALADARLRLELREALRASPLTEHKLHLKEFAATPTGQLLVSGAATALNVSAESIQTIISNLPAIDLYVPSAFHRRGWNGNEHVQVGASMASRQDEVATYRSAGGRGRATQANWRAGEPVIVLQLAERSSRRFGPQPSRAGGPIEDPNEGILGGSVVEYLPDGSTKETDLANYYGSNLRFTLPPCEPDCGGGGSGAADETYMRSLVVIDVCDNFDCYQGNEFEWHTYFSENNGASFGNRKDTRLEGIPSNYEALVNGLVLYRKIRQNALSDLVQSDVVETDSWSPSDHFGSPQWRREDNGLMKAEGETRCGYDRIVDGQWSGYWDCGLFFWREVNQSFIWSY